MQISILKLRANISNAPTPFTIKNMAHTFANSENRRQAAGATITVGAMSAMGAGGIWECCPHYVEPAAVRSQSRQMTC